MGWLHQCMSSYIIWTRYSQLCTVKLFAQLLKWYIQPHQHLLPEGIWSSSSSSIFYSHTHYFWQNYPHKNRATAIDISIRNTSNRQKYLIVTSFTRWGGGNLGGWVSKHCGVARVHFNGQTVHVSHSVQTLIQLSSEEQQRTNKKPRNQITNACFTFLGIQGRLPAFQNRQYDISRT